LHQLEKPGFGRVFLRPAAKHKNLQNQRKKSGFFYRIRFSFLNPLAKSESCAIMIAVEIFSKYNTRVF